MLTPQSMILIGDGTGAHRIGGGEDIPAHEHGGEQLLADGFDILDSILPALGVDGCDGFGNGVGLGLGVHMNLVD